MKKKKRARWLLLAMALLPAAVAAGELRYTYGEARFVAADPRGAGRATGLGVTVSALVARSVFTFGSYRQVQGVDDPGEDTALLELGTGLRYPFTASVDIVGSGGLVGVDRHRAARDEERLGFFLAGGGRAALTRFFEGGVRLQYVQVFGDGDLYVSGDALCPLSPRLALLAGAQASDRDRILSLGARLSF